MAKKVGLATIAGFITMMILGYLIWGVILSSMMEEAMAAAGDCMKEPEMSYIAIANLLGALFLALVLYKFNATTAMSGLIAGAWVMLLISVVNGVWFTTSFDWYPAHAILVDAVTGAVMGGVSGAVVGWVLGKVN